jgi:hypothetical protein
MSKVWIVEIGNDHQGKSVVIDDKIFESEEEARTKSQEFNNKYEGLWSRVRGPVEVLLDLKWHIELEKLCKFVRKTYGRSDKVTFANLSLRRSQLNKLMEFVPDEVKFTGSKTYTYYPGEEVVVDFSAPAQSAWMTFFVWPQETPMPDGVALEFHIGREGFTETYVFDGFGNPSISSNCHIMAFAETGYEGSPGGSKKITAQTALDIVDYVKEIVRYED